MQKYVKNEQMRKNMSKMNKCKNVKNEQMQKCQKWTNAKICKKLKKAKL
jgi:hypothetical protein